MGEKDDTSNLDEPPFGGFDTDICHSGDAKIDWFSVGKTGRLWMPTATRLAGMGEMLMLLINLLCALQIDVRGFAKSMLVGRPCLS